MKKGRVLTPAEIATMRAELADITTPAPRDRPWWDCHNIVETIDALREERDEARRAVLTLFRGKPGCEWPTQKERPLEEIDAEARGEVRRVILALHAVTLTLDKRTVGHVLMKDKDLAEELLRAHDSLAANLGELERALYPR